MLSSLSLTANDSIFASWIESDTDAGDDGDEDDDDGEVDDDDENGDGSWKLSSP